VGVEDIVRSVFADNASEVEEVAEGVFLSEAGQEENAGFSEIVGVGLILRGAGEEVGVDALAVHTLCEMKEPGFNASALQLPKGMQHANRAPSRNGLRQLI
jgi:hypothetical protein